jgi:hypothetical protein
LNKIYRVVWNVELGQWVVASEVAKGRKKAGSSERLLAAVLVGTAGFGGLMASADADAQVRPGSGSLELCYGTSGRSEGVSGTTSLNCINNGQGMAFSLNNYGDANGAPGYLDSTVRVAGYADGRLELKASSGIDTLGTMRMNNNKITGLSAGSISAGSTDAVRGDHR